MQLGITTFGAIEGFALSEAFDECERANYQVDAIYAKHEQKSTIQLILLVFNWLFLFSSGKLHILVEFRNLKRYQIKNLSIFVSNVFILCKMEVFSIYAVIVLNTFVTLFYCWLIYKGRIEPALAMWVFFTLAVGMSLVTYLSNDHYSFLDNILNTTDLALVSIVMFFVLFMGKKASRFNKFDKICLLVVVFIIVFWVVTWDHLTTNIAIQTIMVITYFPVIRRMLTARKNTEPFSVWIGIFLVALISLFSGKGILANIYALRAVACTAFLLILMLRIELKYRKSQKLKLV